MKFSNTIATKLLRSKGNSSSFIIKLSYFAIALGLCIIIVGTSLINGFQREIADKIYTFLGHIEVSSYDAFNMSEGIPIVYDQKEFEFLKNKENFNKPDAEGETTKGGIESVQKIALTNVIIQSKTDMDGMLLKGIGSDFSKAFWERYLVEGDALMVQADSLQKSLVISRATAKRLKTEVGGYLIVFFVNNNKQYRTKMKVVGLYETEMPEYDIRYAFTDIKSVQNHYAWKTDEVSKVEIFVEHTEDIDIITEEVYQNLPMGYFATSVEDNQYAIFSWLKSQDMLKLPIIGLMIIVCMLNMITMLLILILDRTTMIGVLKALGANNADMRSVFIQYSGRIILRGMLLGNVMGIGLCLLQQQYGFITLPAKDYYISTAAIDLDFWNILALNLLFFVVILLTILIPTYLINRVSPVKSIRMK